MVSTYGIVELPEEEERVRNFFVEQEDDSEEEVERYDNESDFDDVDADPNFVINENEHFDNDDEDDNELSAEGDEELEPAIDPNRGQKYTAHGKNCKTVWWSMPSLATKTRAESRKAIREASSGCLKEEFEDKKKTFTRIFPPHIVGKIVIETNRKAKRVYDENIRSDHRKGMRKWRNTTAEEIFAYIAILLRAGVEKANHTRPAELFEKGNIPFYRAVMSLVCFEQLTRFIRFDDSRTRMLRIRDDKLAPIRHVWDIFRRNMSLANKNNGRL